MGYSEATDVLGMLVAGDWLHDDVNLTVLPTQVMVEAEKENYNYNSTGSWGVHIIGGQDDIGEAAPDLLAQLLWLGFSNREMIRIIQKTWNNKNTRDGEKYLEKIEPSREVL